ncbi:hypothetical protein EIN_057260 [Entamoeba invadens IP1]|uniref:hypothetical protein n=1 Tax=Entamoeba invadens IP1 TaxID=370355 RepID=UPI0002C3EF87|nr:hypothetical protein EIN_057260 [Entamoeba invadens IP1]ELP93341.1 hypothetical protein EIN_057260 [Entamoeba invadens IP1]|eukprot:XP_004260112.1 hypothetical protein EIN_057260 [Entamoeba invadens IP1]
MDVNSVEISIPADSTVEQLVQEVTNEMHRNGMLLQFTEIPQQFDKITVRDFLSRGLSFVINETIEGKAQKNISPFPQKLGEKVEKEDKDDVVIFQTAQTDAQEEGSEDYGFTGTPEVWKPQHTIQSDSKAPKPPVLVAGSEKPKEVFTCHSCKIKKAIAFQVPSQQAA